MGSKFPMLSNVETVGSWWCTIEWPSRFLRVWFPQMSRFPRLWETSENECQRFGQFGIPQGGVTVRQEAHPLVHHSRRWLYLPISTFPSTWQWRIRGSSRDTTRCCGTPRARSLLHSLTRQKKTAMTKIDVTQAGSDWSFKRESVNSVLRRSFFEAGDTHLSNEYIQEFKNSNPPLFVCASDHLSVNRYWSRYLHDGQDSISLTDSFYWGYDLPIRVRRARWHHVETSFECVIVIVIVIVRVVSRCDKESIHPSTTQGGEVGMARRRGTRDVCWRWPEIQRCSHQIRCTWSKGMSDGSSWQLRWLLLWTRSSSVDVRCAICHQRAPSALGWSRWEERAFARICEDGQFLLGTARWANVVDASAAIQPSSGPCVFTSWAWKVIRGR